MSNTVVGRIRLRREPHDDGVGVGRIRLRVNLTTKPDPLNPNSNLQVAESKRDPYNPSLDTS